MRAVIGDDEHLRSPRPAKFIHMSESLSFALALWGDAASRDPT